MLFIDLPPISLPRTRLCISPLRGKHLEPVSTVNRFVEKASRRTSTRRGLIMNKLLNGVATAAIVVLALPAWAQGVTTQGQPTRENAPGAAGTSKPRRSWTTPRQIRADPDPLGQ